jgi:hypothetical protein
LALAQLDAVRHGTLAAFPSALRISPRSSTAITVNNPDYNQLSDIFHPVPEFSKRLVFH